MSFDGPSFRDVEEAEEEISEEMIKKENIVLTAQINPLLPLFLISCMMPQFTKTKPEATSAIVLRHVTPNGKKISTNIFPSGKVVITGAKTIFEAYYCLFNALCLIQSIVTTRVLQGDNLSLRNIVMTITVAGYNIDIESLARENKKNVILDKAKFPGAIMSVPPEKNENNPTANIFSSGKVVLPGPSNDDYARKCVKWVYKEIRPYLKKRKVSDLDLSTDPVEITNQTFEDEIIEFEEDK